MKNILLINENILFESQKILKGDIRYINFCIGELKESIKLSLSYPSGHDFYHTLPEDVIELTHSKALEDLQFMSDNIASLSEEWLTALFIYYFEYRVHLLLPTLWFLPKRLELDTVLEKEISELNSELVFDLKNYDRLKKISITSDSNICNFELKNYEVVSKKNDHRQNTKLSKLLHWLDQSKNQPNLKLVLEVLY